MKEKKVSSLGFGSIVYFITRAFLISITFNILIKSIKQDSWIVPLISIIIGLIYILFLNNIMNYKPDLTLTKKIFNLFNKYFAIIIVITFIVFAGFLGIINYLNLTNFIQSQFLSKTPIIVIAIIFAIPSLYLLNNNIKTITKTSIILFYINIFLLIISILGLLPTFKLDNIKPFFYNEIKSYFNPIISFFSYNIATLFMLLIIPKNNIESKNIKKDCIKFFILSVISMFFTIILTISVFGYELTLLYEYPEFHVLKQIELIGLSSRIESILSIQLIFDIFICNIFIIYFLSNIFKDIFNLKNTNLINLIISSIFIILSTIFSTYNIYIDNLILSIVPIISAIYIVIINIIINLKISKN